MTEEDRKLQIDDDWKSEAAAEKERLSQAVESEQQKTQLPEASFSEIVQILAMQAMVGLGGMKTPTGQNIPPNLDIAKHHIDMLDILEKKTAGNLSEEEKHLIDTTLHQLRMAYVEIVQGGAPGQPQA